MIKPEARSKAFNTEAQRTQRGEIVKRADFKAEKQSY